jgi:hypothetical protein
MYRRLVASPAAECVVRVFVTSLARGDAMLCVKLYVACVVNRPLASQNVLVVEVLVLQNTEKESSTDRQIVSSQLCMLIFSPTLCYQPGPSALIGCWI